MRTLNFAKRNLTEMVRDPLIYIFCVGFPVALIALFAVINSFTGGMTPVFEPRSLIPGIMMFSFTFVMLLMSLLVSKDRTSAFLIRLYASPMTTKDFVLGYAIPAFLIGVAQEIVCLAAGFFVALITGAEYFSFAAAILLMAEMLPMLVFCTATGILLGTALNEKSAPGITSVFITCSGILGGAWMPLDTMGAFETFCRFLPFYPSVYLGRVITGANHSVTDYVSMTVEPYAFDGVAKWGVVAVALYTILSVALALFLFRKKMKSDKR